MQNKAYGSPFFKIRELYGPLHIAPELKADNALYTYNQLMKHEGDIDFLFVFDTEEAYVPSLVAFCMHFKIALFKVAKEDQIEIIGRFSYAKLLGVPKESALSKYIKSRIEKIKIDEIGQKILDISIGKE
ncbi:hypothetical protein ENBRE01_2235 [Enteropsectra breve]|nr:hypothetical protein ENBRE01_1233 [Enteropsectra breve]KAI5151581.1 hypothetical protein ENBRE01_2235 [Enteropsectra breve]